MKLLFRFVADVLVIAASLLPKSISLSSLGFVGISDGSDGVLEKRKSKFVNLRDRRIESENVFLPSFVQMANVK